MLPRQLTWRLHFWRISIRRLSSLIGWSRTDGPPRTSNPPDRNDPAAMPVVMCCWRRLHRLKRTIELLASQTAPVSLHVWLNDGSAESYVTEILRDAPFHTSLTVSRRNIGGFGRFYRARELARDGHRSVVFIDDDQEFGPDTIQRLVDDHKPSTMSGWWAFRFGPGDRDERTRVEPGASADYVGTCGMVADTAVFLDPRLFACPRRYWFVEDIWLSYVATHLLRWKLFRSNAEFDSLNDEHDLFRTLGETKSHLVRHLAKQGWSTGDKAGGGASDRRAPLGERSR